MQQCVKHITLYHSHPVTTSCNKQHFKRKQASKQNSLLKQNQSFSFFGKHGEAHPLMPNEVMDVTKWCKAKTARTFGCTASLVAVAWKLESNTIMIGSDQMLSQCGCAGEGDQEWSLGHVLHAGLLCTSHCHWKGPCAEPVG